MITGNQKRGRGRPPTGKGELIGVRLRPDVLARLDEWRTRQPGIPTRPEALRRLAERGIAADTPDATMALAAAKEAKE